LEKTTLSIMQYSFAKWKVKILQKIRRYIRKSISVSPEERDRHVWRT